MQTEGKKIIRNEIAVELDPFTRRQAHWNYLIGFAIRDRFPSRGPEASRRGANGAVQRIAWEASADFRHRWSEVAVEADGRLGVPWNSTAGARPENQAPGPQSKIYLLKKRVKKRPSFFIFPFRKQKKKKKKLKNKK